MARIKQNKGITMQTTKYELLTAILLIEVETKIVIHTNLELVVIENHITSPLFSMDINTDMKTMVEHLKDISKLTFRILPINEEFTIIRNEIFTRSEINFLK